MVESAPNCRARSSREPHGSGTDHGDGVARLDRTVQHPDLETRRKNVGEVQYLLIGDPLRNLVEAIVGERHPRILGLHPIHQMAQDPTAPVEALAVHTPLAVHAASASRDARDQNLVPLPHIHDGGPGLDDRPDGLVPQGAPIGHRGDVPLEDVQVRAADGRGVDPDYRVGRIFDLGVRLRFPLLVPRAVENQSLHDATSFSLPLMQRILLYPLNGSAAEGAHVA